MLRLDLREFIVNSFTLSILLSILVGFVLLTKTF